MSKQIEIINENLPERPSKFFKLGTKLIDVAKAFKVELEYPILGALVNNKLKDFQYEIYKPKSIRFIDITSAPGLRMYVRSLSFVLLKAAKDLFPEAELKIQHSVSNGYYCEIDGIKNGNSIETIYEIRLRMQQIIDADMPFYREIIPLEQAIQRFEENGYHEKAKLFKSRKILYASVYHLDNNIDYFYGKLVPSTGYLKVFDLVKYYQGMLLQVPSRKNPTEVGELILQPKMFDIFQEFKSWGAILGINTVGSINEKIEAKKAGELIKISEALQEKKVVYIADSIANSKNKVRLVLVSGPSSSGKTTFSKRLGIQLQVAGLLPVQISLDNYFVDREKTPRDANGEYDFESLQAIDIELFNNDLLKLMAGEEIRVSKFSFETGKRYYDNETMKISPTNILIVEGIHALNPELTKLIPHELTFKIYVSALTQVGIDNHNRIPTTDNRLIRRMIRDYKYRGYSAVETLKRWESVRRGENRNIFPFQEQADVMFNSALPFELCVLKYYAEPLLKEVYENVPEYAEAQRLLKFLSYFKPIKPDEIPLTSLLREFIGGSSFNY